MKKKKVTLVEPSEGETIYYCDTRAEAATAMGMVLEKWDGKTPILFTVKEEAVKEADFEQMEDITPKIDNHEIKS